MSLTTDRNDECLNEKKDNGQNQCYLILSEEERAKGFIRPYRDAYVHVGKKIDLRGGTILNREQITKRNPYHNDEFLDKEGWVAFIEYPDSELPYTGKFINQEDLDAIIAGKDRTKGCGARTVMNSREICETYARNPKFYGATFCIGCGKHLPVGEFFWDGTTEEVGS